MHWLAFGVCLKRTLEELQFLATQIFIQHLLQLSKSNLMGVFRCTSTKYLVCHVFI